MTQTLAISKRIVSMEQIHQRFALVQASDDRFFPEWRENLPDLTEAERITLDKYYHRYRRHRDRGELSEGTVKLLLVFPLLELAGFYDEPFFITTEPPVEIVIDDRNEILRGRIDTLVIQQALWVTMVESKRSISFSAALPQALAYMLANPQQPHSLSHPLYGMATDGDLFMFIKLCQDNPAVYDLSEPISLFVTRHNRLYDILRILKQFARQ